MASTRKLVLKAPIGGIHKEAAYQSQPPYTTYDALGFWPWDARTGRHRVANHPGWASWGSFANINMLSSINVATGQAANAYSRKLLVGHDGQVYSISVDVLGVVTSSAVTGAVIPSDHYVECACYGNKAFIPKDAGVNIITFSGGASTHTDLTALANPTANGLIVNCPLVTEFGGRIVLAGHPSQPNVVNMSRVDDPLDWVVAPDTGSPISSTDLSGGTIQEPVVDMIAHNRGCLLCLSYTSIYIYRGNPTDGGTLERLCYGAGITNAGAWCKAFPDDSTYFMTRDGLYRMEPGCGTIPQPVSRLKVPLSLINIDGVNSFAYLAYDVRFHGIHIAVSGTANEYWWFDIETASFWRMIPPGGIVGAMYRFDPIEATNISGVLTGTTSGAFRLSRNVAIGGGTKAFFYPAVTRLAATPGDKSMVQSVTPIFGDNTTDETGTLAFYGGENAETALKLKAERSFAVPSGSYLPYDPVSRPNSKGNTQLMPRIGGNALASKYTQGDMAKFVSYEEMGLTIRSEGSDRP